MAVTLHLSSTRILENPTEGTLVGVFSVEGDTSGGAFVYTLADSIADRFSIFRNRLLVKTGGSDLFDFESEDSNDFDIEVTATSGDIVITKAFTISVIDDTAPTNIELSNSIISEDVTNGTEIGALSAIDDSGDAIVFTLLNDADGRFGTSNGKLIVKDSSKLDFPTAASHQITVQAKDPDGNVLQKTLTISLTDALEIINGTSKNDNLVGTNGMDLINGWSGNDVISGLRGDDVINGGLGKDILYGGAGKDIFVFDTPLKKGQFDQVRDFNVADDTLQFSLSAFKSFKVKAPKKSGQPDDKISYMGLNKFFKPGKLDKKFYRLDKPKDSNDIIYYNKKNGFVYLDVDGSGKEKPIEILKLQKGLKLTVDDFLFI